MLDGFFGSFVGFTTALALALLLVIGALLLVRRVTGRKQIVLDEWADLRSKPDEQLGRSLGSMVVHHLRAIQRLHERSGEHVDIASAGGIPTFAQGLDDDIELLGSARLGSAPEALTALLVFILQAFPFLSRRTRLSGSIHEHGTSRRLQAVLENYRHPATGTRCTRLWEVVGASGDDASIPEDVEQLAYRIYLDLLPEAGFKSWECFREFTRGLARHIDHMDLGRPKDFERAEAHYRNALKLEGGNQVVSYNLGVLLYTLYSSGSSNDEALDRFRVGITSRNDDLRARANAAMANALATRAHRFEEGGRRDLEEALVLAAEAVKLQPKSDVAAKARGYAHHQLGEWLYKYGGGLEKEQASSSHRADARREYERALELNSGHFVAANNLANLLLEWAKVTADKEKANALLDEAAKAAERALRTNPVYHHAHDNVGNIFLERGDCPRALLAFRTALRFQPKYPEAANDIALVYIDDRNVPAVPAKEAYKNHLAALQLTDEASERQRSKLCRMFVDTAASLRSRGHLVNDLRGEVLGPKDEIPGSKLCTCQEKWKGRGLP